MKRARLTRLLDNATLDRVERMRLAATRRFVNRSRGEHLAGKGGSSTEFSDYRDYAAGDDMRYVDWNIFARLQRPYLKVFHLEQELHVVLIIDASASMAFEGKLERALQLAAAFGVMGLFGSERVSAWAWSGRERAPAQLPPCGGRASMAKLFAFLEGVEPGGDAPLEWSLESTLRLHRGRGVALVLSDFLTPGSLRRAFNGLFGAGLEVFAVQLLSPAEIDPDVTGDLRMVDCETEKTLDVSAAGHLVELYQEYRARHQCELETLARQRCGRFVSLDASAPIEWVLFDLLRRRGWIR